MNDLRSIREQRKLTQEDLSSLSGLPQSHLSALENGRFLPNKKTRKRVEQIVGHYSIDWQQTVTGDKDYITRQLVELINLQVEGVQERIGHVKRVLQTIEQNLKTLENDK